MNPASLAIPSSRSLPIFLNEDNKYPVGLFMFALSALLYLTCNHFHLSPPRQLPLTWIDTATPFIPATMWVYVSEYVFFIAIYVSCRDLVNLNKYLYSFFTLQIVSCFIFWAWPSTYPRDLFPLPENLDPLTRYVFSSLRQTDTPANCCPSLHVSSVYLSSFLFVDERRRLFPLFLTWGTLIAVSTLTTKQHYLVDVVAGLLMAILVYVIFHCWARYRDGAHANR